MSGSLSSFRPLQPVCVEGACVLEGIRRSPLPLSPTLCDSLLAGASLVMCGDLLLIVGVNDAFRLILFLTLPQRQEFRSRFQIVLDSLSEALWPNLERPFPVVCQCPHFLSFPRPTVMLVPQSPPAGYCLFVPSFLDFAAFTCLGAFVSPWFSSPSFPTLFSPCLSLSPSCPRKVLCSPYPPSSVAVVYAP